MMIPIYKKDVPNVYFKHDNPIAFYSISKLLKSLKAFAIEMTPKKPTYE